MSSPLAAAWLTLTVAAPLAAQGTRADYERAERFLPWRADSLVRNAQVRPNWIREADRFWYRRDLPDGAEFVLVDPAAAARGPAFDHARLADTLTRVLEREIRATHLPFESFAFTDDDRAIEFRAGRSDWRCALPSYTCERSDRADEPDGASPDGTWVAFTRDHDLWVRHADTGAEVRLTRDGTAEYPWAARLPSPTVMVRDRTEHPALAPAVTWSPDSRWLSAVRIDARGAGTLSMVQHAPPDRVRPRHYTYFYPLAEDSVLPTATFWLFEAGVWAPKRVPLEPVPLQYYGGPRGLSWDDTGPPYAIVTDRGYRSRRAYGVTPETAGVRVMVEDRIEPYANVYGGTDLGFLRGGAEVVWASERDGWRHLYLFEVATGRVVRQLTAGRWVVESIEHIDPASRTIWFRANGREAGRDPYLMHLYRVSADGGAPRLLTPEDADHGVDVSPTGNFFVDTYSRPHVEPVSVLRRATDGAVVMELERADITRLLATGWRRPTPFTARARDGSTDVYGLVWWPSTLDTAQRYPVVEQIYTGPHSFFVPKSFNAYRNTAQTIAELGFVVVQVDGLGTDGRGRAFRLHSWQNLGDGGIPDHIAWMRALAAHYPFIDLSRVGIYGHSAGGYDAARAILTHGDFYDVAVSSAGNHDHRMDKAVWNVQWMGWPVGDHYREQSNVTQAHRLEGKLLLAHGDVDENVPVSSTLQLVNALVAANKDFDLLILPNRTHSFGRETYFIRKRWDYFVKHLLGVEPPADYAIAGPDN